MTSTTFCRLCIEACKEFKCLVDANDQVNSVYNIAAKYFDPKFLHPGKGHNSTVICTECWRQVMDFHQFCQLIINRHSTLDYENPINGNFKLEKQDTEGEHIFLCNSDAVVHNEIHLLTSDEVDIKEELSLDYSELSEFNIFHINETNDMQVDNITNEFAKPKKDHNIIPKIYQCNLCETCFENFRALEEHSCQISNDDENEGCSNEISTFNDNEIQMLKEIKEPSISFKQNQTEMQQSKGAFPDHVLPQTNENTITKYMQTPDKSPLERTSFRKRKVKENDAFIAELKGKLECTICKELLTNYTSLNDHFLIKHPDQECHVFCCEKKFNKRWKLVAHLQQFHNRTNSNSYNCNSCGATFSEYGNLRRHIRKKHPTQSSVRKWLCKYCNQMFKTRSNLEQHKKLEHSNKELEEGLNEQTVQIQNDNLSNFIEPPDKNQDLIIKKSHISSIEQQTEFNDLSCSSDSLSFSSDNDSSAEKYNFKEIKKASVSNKDKRVLEYDNFIAKRKKYLECPICKILIENFSLLSNHFHMEHPDKQCHINCCQTDLTDRLEIVKHLKHHRDVKEFQCDICNKSFNNVKGLESHKRQVHIEKRSTYHSHLCYCKKSNLQENSINSNVYDTTVCCQRKQKILEDDAIIAKWKGDLKCSTCTSIFSYYSSLRVHYYYAHPGERCFIECCERKFYKLLDALQHIRVHLDPSAFKCEICDLKFCGKSRLMAHMRKVHGKTLQQKFSCDQCDQTFEHRIILPRHKNYNHTKKVK